MIEFCVVLLQSRINEAKDERNDDMNGWILSSQLSSFVVLIICTKNEICKENSGCNIKNESGDVRHDIIIVFEEKVVSKSKDEFVKFSVSFVLRIAEGEGEVLYELGNE